MGVVWQHALPYRRGQSNVLETTGQYARRLRNYSHTLRVPYVTPCPGSWGSSGLATAEAIAPTLIGAGEELTSDSRPRKYHSILPTILALVGRPYWALLSGNPRGS